MCESTYMWHSNLVLPTPDRHPTYRMPSPRGRTGARGSTGIQAFASTKRADRGGAERVPAPLPAAGTASGTPSWTISTSVPPPASVSGVVIVIVPRDPGASVPNPRPTTGSPGTSRAKRPWQAAVCGDDPPSAPGGSQIRETRRPRRASHRSGRPAVRARLERVHPAPRPRRHPPPRDPASAPTGARWTAGRDAFTCPEVRVVHTVTSCRGGEAPARRREGPPSHPVPRTTATGQSAWYSSD